MSRPLRGYQSQIISDLQSSFRSGKKSALAVLPTGGGKTRIIQDIVHKADQKGSSVCVIAHRKELVEQIAGAVRQAGIEPGIIAPGGSIRMRINIASVQTLVRDPSIITAPDLLITDEAHHATAGSWRKISDAWSNARHIGLTATPCRLDGSGLGDVFEEMILGPSPSWLTENGFLVPADVYAPSVPDLAGVRTRCGEWTISDLEKAIEKSSVVGDAVKSFLSFFPVQGTAVAFCASVIHARITAEAFNAAGVPAAVLTGSDHREDRERVLEDLATGRVRVLCSVDVISEGFDLPLISSAILLRPTKSLSLYLQQVGRALRPAEGKERAIILDHAGNALRHGLPSEDREWSLAGEDEAARDRRTAEDGTAISVRQCPACFAVYSHANKCPYCGHEQEPDQRIPKARAGELRKLEAEEMERIRREQRRDQGRARTEAELTAMFIKQGANRWKAAARARKVIEAREAKDRKTDREDPLAGLIDRLGA